MARQPDDSGEVALIVNPESGSADHVDSIENRASILGYRVRTTDHRGHAVTLTEEAIDAGARMVVAVGGDGTLNEVIRGVIAADAIEDVTVGVIPAGTGNDFASNIGIRDIEEGFTVLQDGNRRRLDLGMANDEPFINSCIAGLTAEASADTSPAMKSRYGVLAYAMTTLSVLTDFQGLELTATITEEASSETVWSGSAAMVLVGNGRKFSITGSDQAHVEDGLLDVTIIEDAAAIDIVGDRTRERLFGEGGEHVTHVLASSLDLSVDTNEPTAFSLDGEMAEFTSVELSALARSLRMPVGEGYEPQPAEHDDSKG